MEKDIEKFIRYLKEQKNYSKYTISTYEEDLIFLSKYLEKEGISYLDIDYSTIRLYFNYLDSFNYSKNTIAKKITSARSFYKYLARNNKIKTNPFSLCSLPKKDKYTISTYEEDLIFLSKYLEKEGISYLDIDLKEKYIKILGKGNKERIVYFGDYAKEYLEKYIYEVRDNLLKNKKSDYLFINNSGTNLSSRGVELIIKNIIKETSIKSNITPHVLRHTFATHLLNEGCDILSVQELLGHESLRATQVYTHITNEGLRNIYNISHPRNHKNIK
ncbi:MAG: hypothetical protein BHW63_01940 [Mycoplasma sp. CAG:611_25_7]|nr:MAG: hypothetical protein BHW63_01940 [Mycoplasma sp. CAG:611_25_7]